MRWYHRRFRVIPIAVVLAWVTGATRRERARRDRLQALTAALAGCNAAVQTLGEELHALVNALAERISPPHP